MTALSIPRAIYLETFLQPFARWLTAPDVTEILVNRPGEIWIETLGAPAMQRHDVPTIDDALLQRLAEQIARTTHQAINRETPLLSATLADGARVQIVGPPATRRHWALAIRRHIVPDLSLDDFHFAGDVPMTEDGSDRRDTTPLDRLRAAIAARRTVLVSGGTSSGKTTFLNALLREVPRSERLVVIEDTPELEFPHPNAVGLVAVKGGLGESNVTTDDLLQAGLRLRPDRIIVGEIRGREVAGFLRAINTGHPGSFATIHANSPQGALDQITLLTMQAGLSLSRAEIVAYARSVIDVVVQLERRGGRRWITGIEFLCD